MPKAKKTAALAAQGLEKRLTPEQFKALAKHKGWKLVDIAKRWGVTGDWIAREARNPNRAIRFDDALHGLPNLNRALQDVARRERAARIALERLQNKKAAAPPVQRPVPAGYRYRDYLTVGSIVTAGVEVGSVAEEGMRGIVFEVRDLGSSQQFGVIFESGLWDWFAPDHIDAYLVSTGLDCAAAQEYRYVDEISLQRDFDVGLFEFWPVVT